MSPRAACRLESLGFTAVYDYAAGKTDWTGSGGPTEGTHADIPRPGRLTQPVATCTLTETVAVARDRVGTGDMCIVISDDAIVLGRLRRDALEGAGDRVAADVMEPGPTTVRYDESLPGLVERMQKTRVGSIIVTEPSGRLVGVMYRRDAESVLEQLQQAHEHHHH